MDGDVSDIKSVSLPSPSTCGEQPCVFFLLRLDLRFEVVEIGAADSEPFSEGRDEELRCVS